MADNFSINLNAVLNTNNVEKQIKDLNLKLKSTNTMKIKVNGEEAIKQVRTLTDEFGNLYKAYNQITASGKYTEGFKSISSSIKTITTEVNKWKDSSGAINTWTTKIDSLGKTITTRVKEFTDETGRLHKETSDWGRDASGKFTQLGETIKETSRDETKLAEATEKLAQAERERMADVSKTTTYSKQMVDGHKALVKTIEEIDNKGQKTTTTIAQYKNELEQTVTVTNKFDEAGNKMQGTITEIDGKVRRLGASFLETVGKVAKFYVATIPIQMVQTATTEAIETVKEFDEALVEFQKVSDFSGEALDNYTIKLGELGEAVGRTRTEMIEGATEFQKSGFGKIDENLPAQLAQITALYQNIADEELSVADASSVIISQMKAFGYETALEATHVVDSINKVSNEFAVSSGDIGRGLTQAGAALSTYGNSFEEVVGLVSAGTEIFQGKSQQVARGLNTVASRIVKNESALKQYGVSIKDDNENLRSTYDILSDLAPKWEEMSEAEKVSLGTALAGVNQYKVFSAVMQNFQTAIDATTTAYNSSGSAMAENAKYMDSIEGKTQQLKAQFQEFVLGDGGLQSFAKDLLDVSVSALKLINDLGGLSTVLFEIVSIIALVKLESIIGGIDKFITKIDKMHDMILIVSNAYQTWRQSGVSMITTLESQAVAVDTLKLSVGGLIAVLSLLYMANEAYESSQRKALQTAQETLSNLESYNNNASSTLQQIQNESTSREQLVSILSSLNNAYDEESDKLKSINELRQEATEELYKEAKQEAKETVKEITAEYEKQSKFLSEAYNDGSINIWNNPKEALESYSKTIEEYQQRIDDGEKLSWLEQKNLEATTAQYIELKTKIENAEEIVTKYNEAKEMSTLSLTEWIAKQQESVDLTEEESNTLDGLVEQYKLTAEQISTVYSMIQEAIDKGEDYDIESIVQQVASLNQNAETTDQIFMGLLNTITSLQDNYDVLTGAVNEFNTTGTISAKTLKSLTELGDDWVNLLSFENGQLTLNEQGYLNLANAQIDEAEAMAIVKAETELASIANNTYTTTQEGVVTASGEVSTAVLQAGKDAYQSGVDASNGGELWSKFWEQLTNEADVGYENFTEKQKEYAKDVENSLKVQMTALESSRKSLGTHSNSVDKATKSTRSNSKAVDENTQALQDNVNALKAQKEALQKVVDTLNDEVKAYDKVISYINKKVDEEIERLENLRDIALGDIDNQIEALEKEADAFVESIEKEIDALEKAQDSEDERIEQEIDNFEKLKDAEDERIEQEIEALKKAQDAEDERIDNQLNNLKKLQDERDDYYDTEIDRIKELKDTEKEYWDNKINALKDQNSKLQDQIKYQQLLEDLEKAKSQKVRVYREGQGYVYEEDKSAISKAQQSIEEFERQKQYEKELKELEKQRDAQDKIYQQQLDSLKKKKEQEHNTYQAEINDLKEYKKNLDSQYSAQINSLKEYKKEYDKQLNAQINSLKEYKKEYDKQLNAQINSLKEYKDNVKAQYDADIANLNAHRASVKANWDSQIEYYKNWKKQFKAQVDAYENEQNRLKALELTGIDFEQEGWKTRLNNLTNFVANYQNKLGELSNAQTQLNSATDALNEAQKALEVAKTSSSTTSSSGGGGGSTYVAPAPTTTTTTAPATKPYTVFQILGTYSSNGEATSKIGYLGGDGSTAYGGKYIVYKRLGQYATEKEAGNAVVVKKRSTGKGNFGYKQFASGTPYINQDQIAIVGENPYKEVVLGSKVNNGTMMSLPQGSGVVNAKSTRTLAGLLNQLGGMNIGNSYPTTNNSQATHISIGNISLPQVKNGSDFIDYLQNFSLDMKQKAYT